MVDSVPCFLAHRTDYFVRELRRYSLCQGENRCPNEYHNARVKIDILHRVDATDREGREVENWPWEDRRWPAYCDHCQYKFHKTDNYQCLDHRLYQHPATLELFMLIQAPAGAMWDAYWLGDHYKGPDGKHLMVMLPSREQWCIDGPDRDGQRPWKRNGKPPLITVVPSIVTPVYQGWLHEGKLYRAIEGTQWEAGHGG